MKDLRQGDHVLPVKSHAGTWRNLAVWKTKDLLKAGPPAEAHGHMCQHSIVACNAGVSAAEYLWQ